MTIHSLVINMGPHKTGSSAIAQYFSDATHEGSLDPTLLYPTAGLWLNTTLRLVKHDDLSRSLFPREGDTWKPLSKTALRDAFAGLREEAEQRGLEKVTTILVSESLSSRADPDVLGDFLRPYFDDITLVVFCRKQDSAVSSMISQGIKVWWQPGKSTEIDDYLEDGLYFAEDFDYLQSLKKWSAASSQFTVKFVPYLEGEEGTITIFERFCAAASLGPVSGSTSVRPNKANRALSKESLDVMCEIKVQRDLLDPRDPEQKRLERRFWDVLRLFEFMNADEGRGSSSFDNPWVLDSAERRKILTAFQTSNTEFLKAVDRSRFESEWDRWEESVQSLPFSENGHGDGGPTKLFVDVTGLPETTYVSMRSALSIAESRGLRSLTQCQYVVFDRKINSYRIISSQKRLVFRSESGLGAHMRTTLRGAFNSSRKKLRRVRYLIPPAMIQSLRSLYEKSLSEAKVTKTQTNAVGWPVWVPATCDAVGFLVEPLSKEHLLAQTAARAATTEVSLRPRE